MKTVSKGDAGGGTSEGEPYQAGTLRYSRRGMRSVFAWLLAGEFVFVLIDMIEPRLLPILLKIHGATDREIALIVGSFNAALQLLIMPPAGYLSDRLRTRWGRRIPLLFWAMPFVSVFLIITPFAPDFAHWLLGVEWLSAWLRSLPAHPTIVVFGVFVILYRSAQTVTNVAFFGLIRDVIPDSHMGRFLALFRLVGAGGSFALSFWLIGYADTYSKPIFIGVAALNLVGFGAICWFVREGEYPPAEPGRSVLEGRRGPFEAFRVFVCESYRHRIYLWVYFVRTCLYGALIGLSGFLVFFPQQELGMSLSAAGQALSWPALAWIVLAYPMGKLVDRYGSLAVLGVGLGVISVGYTASFLLVIGPKTFFVSSMVTGVAFWVVMLAQLKMTQEIFHRQRYSQLAGANTVVQSIAIAAVISPGAGWALDALKDWRQVWDLPLLGEVTLGPYRLTNLMLGALYGAAWLGVL